MKITQHIGVQGALKSYSKTAKKVEKSSKVKTDKVEISNEARDMQTARAAFAKLPEVRQDKVDEIKNLLAEGKYKPSAEDVLDKILGAKI